MKTRTGWLIGMVVLTVVLLTGTQELAVAQTIEIGELGDATLFPESDAGDTDSGTESPEIPDEQVPCAADLNGDDQVGEADIAFTLRSYGRCSHCEADFNADGVVDTVDLAYVLGHWGKCGDAESPRFVLCASRERLLTGPDLRSHAAAGEIIETNDLSDTQIAVCVGDLDEDGAVDRSDITLMYAAMNRGDETADLNSDGYVDRIDLHMLLRHYGPCPNSRETDDAETRSASSYDDGESPSPTRDCIGDFNGDHTVDAADLAQVLGSAGRCKRCAEDMNRDSYVNQVDAALVLGHWGECG